MHVTKVCEDVTKEYLQGALSKLAEIRKGPECEASMTTSVSKC
jgi:hypothetical protein